MIDASLKFEHSNLLKPAPNIQPPNIEIAVLVFLKPPLLKHRF